MGFFFLSGVAAAFPTAAEAPAAPLVTPSYTVTLTGYNAVPAQTDEDPFTTASGAFSNPEVIIARSQDLGEELPFGTIVELDGTEASGPYCGYDTVKPVIGYRIVADTMNARFKNRMDVLFDTKENFIMGDGTTQNASEIMGACLHVTVHPIGRLDGTRPGKFPKTQAELVRLVHGGTALASR